MDAKFLALTVAAELAVPSIVVMLFPNCVGRVAHRFLTTPVADPLFPLSVSVCLLLPVLSFQN